MATSRTNHSRIGNPNKRIYKLCQRWVALAFALRLTARQFFNVDFRYKLVAVKDAHHASYNVDDDPADTIDERALKILKTFLSVRDIQNSTQNSTNQLYHSVDDFFRERNSFYRAWRANTGMDHFFESDDENGGISIVMKNYLSPMTVMTRYISEHSQHQLKLEYRQHRQLLLERRYLVASYSCPIESGNRLHRFMNGLLWAILTNRTLLWRYQNYDVCEEYVEENCANEYHRDLIIGPSDCQGLLERSPWIPSYEEWKDKLLLIHGTNYSSISSSSEENVPLVRATISSSKKKKGPIDNTSLPYDGTFSEELFWILTGKQVELNPGEILTVTPSNKTEHLMKNENLERLEALRSEGAIFLYGMLFESMFTLDPSLDPPKELLHYKDNSTTPTAWTGIRAGNNSDNGNPPFTATVDPANLPTKTIFVHSRHISKGMENYTWPDQLCLKKFMEVSFEYSNHTNHTQQQQPRPPCHVYVMSDRPFTVDRLHATIKEVTHCTSSSRNQSLINEGSESFRAEHGPRAGRGFWEDLALAVHSRHGMIAFVMNRRAFPRTSTSLVLEIVQFRRVLELSRNTNIIHESSRDNGDPEDGGRGSPEFFSCQNPWIPSGIGELLNQ